MAFLNSADGYGSLTKALHWAVVALFAFQLVSAPVMVRLPEESAAARDALYNWHKSIGLVALAVAVLRIWARRAGELPPWAPCLSDHDRGVVHHAERGLYLAMFVMPVTGVLHVMAGGYGVRFAGLFDLPNPLPRWEWLVAVGAWGHVAGAVLLCVALGAHLGVVVRHSVVKRNGLIRRMLPGG
ncbi:cytochrome b [Roseomonas sp. PWR1]|uniref:Cytochrome b n=1 Tax=Roseomonas nitratireducens TaxID=2820810 RepID=A0ABS4APJ8_9PROT|nr:cytochrome b/b6 domain-containing protein [Neoroseomonas nitratireducens]MBP0463285.1 cytochrome b [Neoroseomonas nitratireducens]